MKHLIVIAGPTACGKTALAINVANHYNTAILSADSRQCYKELNIGVARPSVQELAAAPHYFIASHSVHEPVNAALYEAYALNTLQHLFKKHNVVVVTGGTGLYIKALLEGLDDIPETDENIRKEIAAQYQTLGMSWLQQQLMLEDALFAAQGEMQNPQRMMRALEIVRHTGQSIINFRNKHKKEREFTAIQIALTLPREILYERINKRVDAMIERGLESEAKSLLPYKNLNALQTVGYKEFFDYFDGKQTLDRTIELIKQNTRHYAKRQITWFKKQQEMLWLPADDERVAQKIYTLLTQH